MNRAADVALAGSALLAASLVLGLAALFVKLGDRDPVLYRQMRVGKDGVDFELLKLRTMLCYQVERYTERQHRRLEVKPGITGWAQIHGRATLPWDERIELDVWYVEHRSPWVDLKMRGLIRTS